MPILVPKAFDDYFSNVYGARWPALLESLRQDRSSSKVSIGSVTPDSLTDLVFAKQGLCCSRSLLESHYQLDLASVWSVAATDWTLPGHVLDMCAAPGGKSLTLQFLWKGQGRFTLNELSQSRLSRLKSVMRQFSPVSDENLIFHKRDASRWGVNEQNAYDYVICDVPCSGEEHLLEHPAELARWSLKGSERLAIRQHAILCAALDAVRPGGEILYSTCSINTKENDGVIAKFLKKRSDRANVVHKETDLPIERTEYGAQIFPDQTGYGPIYYATLVKQ